MFRKKGADSFSENGNITVLDLQYELPKWSEKGKQIGL